MKRSYRLVALVVALIFAGVACEAGDPAGESTQTVDEEPAAAEDAPQEQEEEANALGTETQPRYSTVTDLQAALESVDLTCQAFETETKVHAKEAAESSSMSETPTNPQTICR